MSILILRTVVGLIVLPSTTNNTYNIPCHSFVKLEFFLKKMGSGPWTGNMDQVVVTAKRAELGIGIFLRRWVELDELS